MEKLKEKEEGNGEDCNEELISDVTSYKSEDLVIYSDCLLLEEDVELLRLVEKSLDRKHKKYLESLAFSFSEAVTKSRKFDEKKKSCNVEELEHVLEHLMVSRRGKNQKKKKKEKRKKKKRKMG